MASEHENADRGPQAVATGIAFVAVAAFFVTVGCVARFGFVRNAGADDFLIMVSLAFSVALTVLIWDREWTDLLTSKPSEVWTDQ